MLEIRNISLSYDENKVLDNISYKFNKGYIYGLIGKNGAGKSSLLKTVVRINRKSTGEVILNGKPITDLDYMKVNLSLVVDTPVYYPDLTLKEHLLLICAMKKIRKNVATKEIDKLIKLLKLEKYANSFPNSLSRGTLQRLNVAIGIIRNEELILMDEPFITLDPVQVETLENLILELKEEGKTFIISSHDIDSLESICDKYLILRDGKLLEYSVDEINRREISKIISDSYGD